MYDLEPADYGEEPFNHWIKRIFGIVLLVLGIAICIYILRVVVSLLTGGDYVELIRSIVPEDLAAAAVSDESGLMVLAKQGLVAFAYLVAVFLLSVAARVANSLLKVGAGLVSSDLGMLAERLRKELVKWRKEEY